MEQRCLLLQVQFLFVLSFTEYGLNVSNETVAMKVKRLSSLVLPVNRSPTSKQVLAWFHKIQAFDIILRYSFSPELHGSYRRECVPLKSIPF